jgi:type II secretory pathway pseudopilin PulG
MKRQRTSAFSLVELTLALGIAAFCLIAVFGLIPIAVLTNRNAGSQTRATNIMTAVMADARATPKANTTSTQFGITFGTAKTLYFDSQGEASCDLAGSQKTDCVSAWSPPIQTRYRLTVTFPTGPTGSSYADLRVTWPAPVDPATTTPGGSVETFAALDRN